MRKILIFVFVFVASLMFFACNTGNKIYVEFETNGGNSIEKVELESLADFKLPTEPTKEGYVFKGWYLDADFTKPFSSLAGEGTITLYAKWEEVKVEETKEYTVTFSDGVASQKVKEGEKATKPADPEKDGFVFKGWFVGETAYDFNSAVTSDVTLTAKWEEVKVEETKEYTVTFSDGVASQKVKEGEKATKPADPEKEGFEFKGWFVGETAYDFNSAVTSDVTLTAKWEEVKVEEGEFTISFELNGGSWEWTVGTIADPAKGIDAVSNLPEIFMADFFTYLLENNLLSSSKVASKLHVSNWAGFSAKYGDPVAWYSATSSGGYSAADGYSELFFDSVNGYEAVGGFLGTSPYKEKYANLTKHAIQLTAARYSIQTTNNSFKGALGFVLDGYFYGTQGLLAADKANAATFNALRGVIPTPTVGYEGSTSSTNAYVVTTGVVGTAVNLVAPVKEGHMFLGWYDNSEFNGEKLTSVAKGTKVYAKWYDLTAPAKTYKINYVLNGGTISGSAPEQFAFGEGAKLPKATKDGFVFTGWSLDQAGENFITEIAALVDKDITVYANWVENDGNVFTITYNYTDGKLPSRAAKDVNEVIEYVFTSYYNWLKPSDDYETFKTKVIAQWKGNQSQGNYKFYKQGGKDQIDANYFVNAPENFDEWNAWFTVFDAQVTAANGAQNAWDSYVGILRLGQWLGKAAPTTWKSSMDQALVNATKIKIPLVTEYKAGDAFELADLVIDDGREFLGWYDAQGNKVEKITADMTGNLVLTAKWSAAVAVESFTVTNKVEKLLKLSTHQLKWTINPSNATNKKVTFKSSNTNVLKVSDNGLIEAVGIGKAKITITVLGNTSLNTELEIEVYVDPCIDGEFTGESYVVVNDTIKLEATIVGAFEDELVWTSKTPEIAIVDNYGNVTGLKEGVVEIEVHCKNNSEISFTFYVTVFSSKPTGVLKLLMDSNNSEIYVRDNLLIGIKIGSDGAYYTDIYGSVSKLLFEDYVVHEDYYLSNPSNKSSLSSTGIEFITVHYAADMPYSSSAMYNGGKNLASYNKSCNTNGTSASWHYSVGNDGIWYCQNEAYGAWHAGASKTMTWTDSGVTTAQVGTDLYTYDVTMGSDGYFYIKGVKTNIKNTSSGTKLNGLGLGVKVVGTKVYLGGHYQNTSYNYISSTGGNNNSIGMETSVREGSDLWLTWQYTAQLCAKLLIKYNLPLNRLVGHHFFSGKWCPQPMLENDIEIWKEFVELTRQEMELYQNYSNYKLSFSSDSEYIDSNGRVVKLPNYTECVKYTVTYSDGTTTKSVTFSTILPGILG